MLESWSKDISTFQCSNGCQNKYAKGVWTTFRGGRSEYKSDKRESDASYLACTDIGSLKGGDSKW